MKPAVRFGLTALVSLLAAGGVWWYLRPKSQAPQNDAPPAAQTAPAPSASQSAPPTATPAAAAAPALFHIEKAKPHTNPLLLDNGKITLKVDAYGAGLQTIELPEFHPNKGDKTTYVLSHTAKSLDGRSLTNGLAASEITVDGSTLTLQNQAWQVVSADKAQTTLSATLKSADGKPVLRIERTWRLAERAYGVDLVQKIVNLDGKAHTLSFAQLAQDDVANDGASYMGDGRKFALGYFSDTQDAARKSVQTDDGFVDRSSIAKEMAMDEAARADKYKSLWPWHSIESAADRAENAAKHGKADTKLAWLGSYNRYFLLALHTPVAADAKDAAGLLPLEDRFPSVRTFVKPHIGQDHEKPEMAQTVQLMLDTGAFTLKGGETKDLSLALYAGPRGNEQLKGGVYQAIGLDQTVRFRLTESFCGCITFQWLAKGLLAFLTFLHAYVTFDWAVAIIVLVLVVRLLLHPITKKSQITMMRFGEQMKAIQPEIEKIKAKYPGDKEKLSQETMRLYREKGVNPANMLGCMPMFLQMPIWSALYAMLYYAFPLRHEAAFYGIFQHLGANWHFLSDLSSPDRFITLFDDGQPHVFSLMIVQFDYSSINILPLLMTVVMYVNMKYTQTPATTDDQRMQQNMMKVMTLVMFPLMLYAAPAGLTLYITASTLAGIVDSMIVRRHVNALKANGTLLSNGPKEPPKPGTLRHWFATRMEYAKAVAEAKRDGKPVPLTPKQAEALKKQQNPFPRGPESRWK